MTPEDLALLTVAINEVNRKASREMREFHPAIHGAAWQMEWTDRANRPTSRL